MENRAIYDTGNSEINSLAAFKRLPCAKPYFHPDYRQPTADDVTTLLRLADLRPKKIAAITGIQWTQKKGSTLIRKWKTSKVNSAGKPNKEHRQISHSSWRLLLLYAGVVEIEDDLCMDSI